MKQTVRIAVRQSQINGKEFFDLTTIDYTPQAVHNRIDESKKTDPLWNASNPVVRISLVTLEEVGR